MALCGNGVRIGMVLTIIVIVRKRIRKVLRRAITASFVMAAGMAPPKVAESLVVRMERHIIPLLPLVFASPSSS